MLRFAITKTESGVEYVALSNFTQAIVGAFITARRTALSQIYSTKLSTWHDKVANWQGEPVSWQDAVAATAFTEDDITTAEQQAANTVLESVKANTVAIL